MEFAFTKELNRRACWRIIREGKLAYVRCQTSYHD